MLSRNQRLLRLAGTASIAVFAVLAFAWTPTLLPLPGCTFKTWTGLDCLTCGLTRSLHAMAHGDVGAAVGFHPMGPLLFLACVVAAGIWGVEAARGKPARIAASRATKRLAVAASACAWVGYWLVRLALELR